MELYYSPLACSMAARIALYEAGMDARFIYVDSRTKKTGDGADFLTINPAGYVPVLRLGDGSLLTENAAILGLLDTMMHPERAPAARAQVQSRVSFINSELHTGCYSTLLDAGAPAEVHAYHLARAKTRFALLDAHLKGRDFLLDGFTVADAYLVTIANWTQVCGPDLSAFPDLSTYLQKIRTHPAVAKAMGEEFRLYQEQQKRRAA